MDNIMLLLDGTEYEVALQTKITGKLKRSLMEISKEYSKKTWDVQNYYAKTVAPYEYPVNFDKMDDNSKKKHIEAEKKHEAAREKLLQETPDILNYYIGITKRFSFIEPIEELEVVPAGCDETAKSEIWNRNKAIKKHNADIEKRNSELRTEAVNDIHMLFFNQFKDEHNAAIAKAAIDYNNEDLKNNKALLDAVCTDVTSEFWADSQDLEMLQEGADFFRKRVGIS